jgi:putative hydrolase of the HAD superfamily
VHERLLAIERENLHLFGYGAKGMTLSMLETAICLTDERISATDLHLLLQLGKETLRHPVELLDGIREAVSEVARECRVVLITKGDLFHQEAKVAASGLGELFHRIEIVSEKNEAAYRRVLDEFAIPASRFLMIGNSLRSDIEPVLDARRLGPAHALPRHLGARDQSTASTRPSAPAARRRAGADTGGAARAAVARRRREAQPLPG